MFRHSDRLPAGPAQSRNVQTHIPWALRMMRPYPNHGSVDYASVAIDPVTQAGRFLDARGRVMEMPKHGTSTGTKESTKTSQGDGQNAGMDADSTSDNDQ
ncbi:putative ATP-grasp-modified RiPP [Yinghuangia sp. YIM S09857]|uniref:putative ATP-grasp-modified RiPP n=1 Tax=Yinghuangia sp. YIM S09857 TaxID=3436929 RepID=UPI003F52F2EE